MGEPITVVSANVSFVTSFPEIKNSGIPAPGPLGANNIFPFPASENAALFALLKKKFGDDDITHAELMTLFNKSIVAIKSKLVLGASYSAAGLQELNNTKEVYDLLNRDGFTFVCSNVLDKYFGTRPSVGFIVNRPITEFLQVTGPAKGKLYNSVNPKDTGPFVTIEAGSLDAFLSYTLTLSDDQQIVSIRDLGSMDEVGNTRNYCLRQSHDPKPDSGRPISMIIKGTVERPEIVHVNCHMPNPSLLKVCTKTGEEFEDITSKKTILQTHVWDSSENLETNIWLKYCQQRLSRTIEEMFGDFGISDLENFTNTVWIITGDFNDIGTLLKEYLGTSGITVFDNQIRFTFKDVGATCCPNTNSSGGEMTNTINPPFNRPFSALGKLKDVATVNQSDKKIYEEEYLSGNVFGGLLVKGDNCGFGGLSSDGLITDATIFPESREEQGSDHLFVVATYTPTPMPPPQVQADGADGEQGPSSPPPPGQGDGEMAGGSRKRKRSKSAKKTKKRKHTKRHNKRKARHHSKRH